VKGLYYNALTFGKSGRGMCTLTPPEPLPTGMISGLFGLSAVPSDRGALLALAAAVPAAAAGLLVWRRLVRWNLRHEALEGCPLGSGVFTYGSIDSTRAPSLELELVQ